MTRTITRILVPTDFSAPSDAALDFAKTIAATFGASLHLLHVFEDPFVTGAFASEAYVPMPADTRAVLLDDARTRLAHRLPAEDQGRYHGTSEIVTGVSAPTIIDFARDNEIDLIVMGTHGRTGMAHLLLGSVAERVVRLAPCPVLTVHQDRVAIQQPARAWLPEMPIEIGA
jgi:nucleotide-binding universal stress UspA family protein